MLRPFLIVHKKTWWGQHTCTTREPESDENDEREGGGSCNTVTRTRGVCDIDTSSFLRFFRRFIIRHRDDVFENIYNHERFFFFEKGLFFNNNKSSFGPF